MSTNYQLNQLEPTTVWQSFGRMYPFLQPYLLRMSGVLAIILLNSACSVAAPLVLGMAIDQAIINPDINKLFMFMGILASLYVITLITNYFQVILMGRLSQNLLVEIRYKLFNKLQDLPLAFFNSNQTGDLISRINSDTDKLNQFFSESVVRFAGSAFVIVGIGTFIFILNWQLALIALSACGVLIIITNIISPSINRKNQKSLQKLGQLSADIQENLSNFKVLIAFNQGHYFIKKFSEYNKANFQAARTATMANSIFVPIYDLAGNIASILVLVFGLVMISQGQLTLGLLISFLSYTDRFYQPLRILASIWSSIQTSTAAWSRIDQILNLDSNMKVDQHLALGGGAQKSPLLELKKVNFGYLPNELILKNVNLRFEQGKTYAIIGPTGGGKSTLAALIARLYDPTHGEILLHGQKMNHYNFEELSQKIGFILQDPFVFSGSLFDNIIYANPHLRSMTMEQLTEELKRLDLSEIMSSFPEGLSTKISPESSLSLGQKQLIAFLRAILRKPELFIMDEATANIDTITEKKLEKIIEQLAPHTTKIIIAHRLNTIKKADEIIFINQGQIQKAISFDDALELINKTKLKS